MLNKKTNKKKEYLENKNIECINKLIKQKNQLHDTWINVTLKEIVNIISYLEKSNFFKKFLCKWKQIIKKKKKIHIICLGIGSFTDQIYTVKKSCFYQFSLIILLKKILNVKNIYIYDPKITDKDKYIYEHFNVKILINKNNKINENEISESENENEVNEYEISENETSENETSENEVNEYEISENETNENEVNEYEISENETNENLINKNLNTKKNKYIEFLLYMPHCDLELYGNILYKILFYKLLKYDNFKFPIKINKLILISNNLHFYEMYEYKYKPFGIPNKAVKLLLKNTKQLNLDINNEILKKLKSNFKISHIVFYIIKNIKEEVHFPILEEYPHIFNDLKIIVFHNISNMLKFWYNIYKNITNSKYKK